MAVQIKTVAIVGLGALGTLYGSHLARRMPEDKLRIIADKARIARYKQERVYCNGEPLRFNYVAPEESPPPADLIIFAVKYIHLDQAIKAAANQVGKDTIIISLLNGIISEEIIGRVYGMNRLLYCVAQGMDAVKSGNRTTYDNMGILCFGDREPGIVTEKTTAVADFFTAMEVPHEIDSNMIRRLWGKFMLNVGVNQAVAVFGENYADIQKEGRARDIMIGAMKEVIVLAGREGIDLQETDLDYWLSIADSLGPRGKPSMRQDIEAERFSEVELFSGTVLQLGKKNGLRTPINQMLFDRIKSIENQY